MWYAATEAVSELQETELDGEVESTELAQMLRVVRF
jgi:hypothetical protein